MKPSEAKVQPNKKDKYFEVPCPGGTIMYDLETFDEGLVGPEVDGQLVSRTKQESTPGGQNDASRKN